MRWGGGGGGAGVVRSPNNSSIYRWGKKQRDYTFIPDVRVEGMKVQSLYFLPYLNIYHTLNDS